MNNLKDIEYGLEIDELEKYLRNRTIAMIGLLDGIGYSPDGYNYLHKMMRSIRLEARKLTTFNAHFQTFNKEEYIEDFLSANISLEEIKKMQHQENEEKIKKALERSALPRDKKLTGIIRDVWKIEESKIIETDASTKLKDVIINHDDVNIFYSANTNVFNEDVPYHLIEEQKKQRERNYHSILSLNPNTQIYAIGLITPKNLKRRTKDIEEINQFYQTLSSEFGMIYIDPKGLEDFLKKDTRGFYLNTEGIAHLSFRCIQAMYKRKIKERKIPNFKITMPNIEKGTEGIEQLERASKRRERNYQKELDNQEMLPFWRKNFLGDCIQEEQEIQKIYKRAKK